MPVILEPQHTCSKCHQTNSLSAFKLRSHKQGRSPAWCKSCRNRQDRDRRVDLRERAINEAFRRLRLQAPPERAFALFAAAAYLAGGWHELGRRLNERLHSPDSRIAVNGVKLIIVLLVAANRLRSDRWRSWARD